MKSYTFIKICFSAALFVMPLCLIAQEENNHSIAYLYRIEGQDSMAVFADTAYIRDKPSTSGKKIAALPAGSKIWVGAAEQEQRVSGFDAAWVSVKYTVNGKTVNGYLWQGLLALGAYQRNGLVFLYGIDHALAAESKEEPPAYFAKVKVLDSAKQTIAAKSWELKSRYSMSFTEGKVLGGMGLDSILYIVRVHFSGEACGIPDDYYYLGWNGKELLSMPGKSSISEAGQFYYSEELLFPSEKGGLPGKIIRLIENEEVLEKVDKKGNPLVEKHAKKEMYSWDGRKAVKL